MSVVNEMTDAPNEMTDTPFGRKISAQAPTGGCSKICVLVPVFVKGWTLPSGQVEVW